MRLSSSGHAFFLRDPDIDTENTKEIIRKKSDTDIEVENKKRNNEIQLANNFDINIGLGNNNNSCMHSSFENEEKSPPNTPNSIEPNFDNLNINDECIYILFIYL